MHGPIWYMFRISRNAVSFGPSALHHPIDRTYFIMPDKRGSHRSRTAMRLIPSRWRNSLLCPRYQPGPLRRIRHDPQPGPFRPRQFGFSRGLPILVRNVEQFRLDTHLAQVEAEQFVMARLEAIARFVGHVGR